MSEETVITKDLDNPIDHIIVRPVQNKKIYDDPYLNNRVKVVLHLPKGHIDQLNDRKINPSDLCFRLIHSYITEYDKNILFIEELMKLFKRQEQLFKEINKLESYKRELDFIEHEIEILLEKVYDNTLNYDKATLHNDIRFLYKKVEEGYTPDMIKSKYKHVAKRLESTYDNFILDKWIYNVYMYLPYSKRQHYKRLHPDIVAKWNSTYKRL